MKEKIYNLLMKNIGNLYYEEKDLINYDELIDKYKDILPSNFTTIVEKNNINKSDIKAVKDKTGDYVDVYILNDIAASRICRCYFEIESDDIELSDFSYISKTEGIEKFKYSEILNPLWNIYLKNDFEKNPDSISRDQMLNSLNSFLLGHCGTNHMKKICLELEEMQEELIPYLDSSIINENETIEVRVRKYPGSIKIMDIVLPTPFEMEEVMPFEDIEIPTKDIIYIGKWVIPILETVIVTNKCYQRIKKTIVKRHQDMLNS